MLFAAGEERIIDLGAFRVIRCEIAEHADCAIYFLPRQFEGFDYPSGSFHWSKREI